jgi:hypothetical protein
MKYLFGALVLCGVFAVSTPAQARKVFLNGVNLNSLDLPAITLNPATDTRKSHGRFAGDDRIWTDRRSSLRKTHKPVAAATASIATPTVVCVPVASE